MENNAVASPPGTDAEGQTTTTTASVTEAAVTTTTTTTAAATTIYPDQITSPSPSASLPSSSYTAPKQELCVVAENATYGEPLHWLFFTRVPCPPGDGRGRRWQNRGDERVCGDVCRQRDWTGGIGFGGGNEEEEEVIGRDANVSYVWHKVMARELDEGMMGAVREVIELHQTEEMRDGFDGSSSSSSSRRMRGGGEDYDDYDDDEEEEKRADREIREEEEDEKARGEEKEWECCQDWVGRVLVELVELGIARRQDVLDLALRADQHVYYPDVVPRSAGEGAAFGVVPLIEHIKAAFAARGV
ncbi:hypothetical protein N3K66_000799 [Trichothecium roseum]|uniref:Uncharacterized protein n=1 Tax=Trichothecium roseum TaxID=47278 RepID=A0ACC0VCX4_9HYPO|nr:hypothetical protein N3K66_000799 [Trichothecium roseum]